MTDPGPADLVERRAALLAARPANGSPEAAELEAVTAELREALGSGEPTVRVLSPSEDLVVRLGMRDPVNPPSGPEDLARRVAADRRVLIVEYPALPGRPLNVVWVALCRGTPAHLQPLLDPDGEVLDPSAADTATYYSIWNAEPGLEGLGRGRQLIESAVALLGDELPGLVTHVTLSPLPGFRSWLSPRGPQRPPDADLVRLATRYLTSLDDRGRPIDPVARFHLGNGARLWRINVGADSSELGRLRSWGVMANYRYVPEDRAANRAELAAGRVPTAPALAPPP